MNECTWVYDPIIGRKILKHAEDCTCTSEEIEEKITDYADLEAELRREQWTI